MTTPDDVRWFDAIGTCRCGKEATGKLMGSRNQSFGAYCRRCAEKRLKAAQRERDDAERVAALDNGLKSASGTLNTNGESNV